MKCITFEFISNVYLLQCSCRFTCGNAANIGGRSAGLLVLQDEAAPIWDAPDKLDKDEIQQVGEPRVTQPMVQVAADDVDLVNDVVYLDRFCSHGKL